MFWTTSGAVLVAYEVWALAFGRTTVSQAAHHSPWAFLVWGWWASLAIHLVREWRKCEEREDRRS